MSGATYRRPPSVTPCAGASTIGDPRAAFVERNVVIDGGAMLLPFTDNDERTRFDSFFAKTAATDTVRAVGLLDASSAKMSSIATLAVLMTGEAAAPTIRCNPSGDFAPAASRPLGCFDFETIFELSTSRGGTETRVKLRKMAVIAVSALQPNTDNTGRSFARKNKSPETWSHGRNHITIYKSLDRFLPFWVSRC